RGERLLFPSRPLSLGLGRENHFSGLTSPEPFSPHHRICLTQKGAAFCPVQEVPCSRLGECLSPAERLYNPGRTRRLLRPDDVSTCFSGRTGSGPSSPASQHRRFRHGTPANRVRCW